MRLVALEPVAHGYRCSQWNEDGRKKTRDARIRRTLAPPATAAAEDRPGTCPRHAPRATHRILRLRIDRRRHRGHPVVRSPPHPETDRVDGGSRHQEPGRRTIDDDARVAAFSAFYRQHYALVLAVCERRLSDHEEAQDVTAEVFRVAWQKFAAADATLPWLYAIARNVIGNEYRRRTRSDALRERVGSVIATSSEAAVDGPDGSDGADLELRRAVAALKPADREVLFLAYWEDLSAADMAQVLGCSAATATTRLSRARAALRAQLDRTAERAGRTGRTDGSGRASATTAGGERRG
ncbi:RNA polymerase sigma factor [Schumannella luteola]